MFAYRAGRIPRYYVNCLAISRAVPLDIPLKRTVSPSSMG